MTNKANKLTDQDINEMAARIIAVWNQATPAQIEAGSVWYAEARELAVTLAAQSGTNADTAAAVIAHLSPRTRWSANVAGATSLMLHGDAPGMIGANVKRAQAAMASDDPISTINGPKTRSFALNILGDNEAVTVDIWALRIATDSDDLKIINRKGGYEGVAKAYRIAARKVGVSPATMQATTWVVARNGAE